MLSFITVLILFGLICGVILFAGPFMVPGTATLPDKIRGRTAHCVKRVSVIIPARNEAGRIGDLLNSLQSQTVLPQEIIVVDDESSDTTAQVARAAGARVVEVSHRPPRWIGKSWACDRGAAAASGEVFLFLDADVSLAEDGIERLLCAFEQLNHGVVSVQPYHRIGRPYESFSALFNLQVVASIGIGGRARGLFGPCIMIAKSAYRRCGGHAAVRDSVVDDVALGQLCRTHGVPLRTYLGGSVVRFRMYAERPQQMLAGWTKNFLQGAGATPSYILFAQSMWIVGAATTAAQTVFAGAGLAIGITPFPLAMGAYVGYSALLAAVLPRHGSFSILTGFLFPVHLVFFACVTLCALWIRARGGAVNWRGREVVPHPRSESE
ncbi:MAG TPA: glycosyltransferase family 2 protein [Alkalispirochaeta sp.]|nr:glycosyltransferase family 2 protein [Alkalispirochaeta sp.]